MKRIFNFNALAIFLILCFSSVVFAQETKISPEKKKVIAEIISVMKADQKLKEVMQAMFKQLDANYPLIVKAMLDKRTGITPAEKTKIEDDLISQQNNFNSRLQQKMIQAIDFQEFIEATFYPLYDKFFTAAQLNDLLEFYKTPTGQKLNDVLPQLSAESVRLSQEYLTPKIEGILQEAIKEQTRKAPPPAKKANK